MKIRIKGNTETNEYQDALQLKKIFELSIDKKINGEILIISNATLFGQETKDVDLIVIGNFEKYSCEIKSKTVNSNKEISEFSKQTVFVNNFCFTIETKRHRAEDVRLDGLKLLVKYNNKFHDATTQSENQKYSLKDFFTDRLKFPPHICNFIWFRNINWESIKLILDNNENLYTKHNYLPNTFSFRFILQLACTQRHPYVSDKGWCSFSCLRKNESFDYSQMESYFEIFERVKIGTGQLTRKKIEQITSKILREQQYAKAIGEKLIVISGRAGTGKTIKLLKIACDLAINKGARSLILTYNHALVSDIKRTLALAEIPDGVDTHTVNITTLHKFIYELIIGFGLVTNPKNPKQEAKYVPEFISKYQSYLQELIEYIEKGLIQEKEIQELMGSKPDSVAWDYILIDEAQDWSNLEKKIIFTIFGKHKTIIADGVDQLIRSQKKCNWVQGLKPELDFKKTNEKKGLRQEVNLISFVNEYAKQAGVVWEIEPKEELIGGKIIVTTKGYTQELHAEQLKHCKDCGNTEYEMMFLVPPNLVNKTYSEDEYGKQLEIRSFKFFNEFKKMGISLWDLTNTDLRTQYPVELTQHRLLQYESCRGLEGWTVVCLELDEFIMHKFRTFVDEKTDELALETFEEKRKRFVYLWSIIPLTRAIDTLIITIKDKNSDIYKYLRKAYEKFPDFVQWID
ncbi:DNA or RNA helicase [Betaproteobacteria bacterium]|nr:DNA or RNA helicase [Betaproteobacteria bacterium]